MGQGFLRTINYIYVFWLLQIFSYGEHLVSRNALFYESPAECLLWHSCA